MGIVKKYITHLGSEFLYFILNAGRMGIYLFTCLFNVIKPPYKIIPVVRQLYFIGARSMTVIVVTGLFTGMVVALLGYHNLQKFGSVDLLGSAVGLGLIQELGPVLAALMVIGRAGSSICAELGIMRHSEQIDALECMGIDPYRFLLVPKYIATIISLPILTCVFIVVGVFGGYLVAVVMHGISEGSYFIGMYDSVKWFDIRLGLTKSLLFGLIIVWISTFKGYFLHLNRSGSFGAEGVSRVTTDAVVLSSISILVGDYLVGTIML